MDIIVNQTLLLSLDLYYKKIFTGDMEQEAIKVWDIDEKRLF